MSRWKADPDRHSHAERSCRAGRFAGLIFRRCYARSRLKVSPIRGGEKSVGDDGIITVADGPKRG